MVDAEIDALHGVFTSGVTRTREWRHQQLSGLASMIDTHKADFVAALNTGAPPCGHRAHAARARAC